MGRSPQKPVRLLAVVGPTASGKSEIASELGKRLGGEIVCCDSVQLYRGFDIGSAKPTSLDYELLPHHLFDSLEWDEPCDAAVYARLAEASITRILSRGKLPIVVGGTGLYLRALVGQKWNDDLPKDSALRESLGSRGSEDLFQELQNRDPRRARELHPNDRFRVIRALEIVHLTGKPVPVAVSPMSEGRDYRVLFMDPPRAVLHARIQERTRLMLDQGLIEEVRELLARGVESSSKPMQSIGYKEVVQFLHGKVSKDELRNRIEAATRQYAKRQWTWFKKVPADYHLSCVSELPSHFAQIERDLVEN